MNPTKIASIGLAAALAALLPAIPAQAEGASRTFVSAAGSDTNNCTNVATPCRHMAAAFAATAANGEIYVLDPANYGSLTITHAVSIEGHGWASIAPVINNPAITINANPGDKINIIGVVLDGTALSGTTGILFNSGGSLTVRDSVIRNFTSIGINFVPNTSALSQLYVSNTLLSDNGNNGIAIIPAGTGTTNGVLDHVELENNPNNGLTVASNSQTINVTVSDSVSANNGGTGIAASSGGPMTVMVQNCKIANNSIGLTAAFAATVLVTRSTITGNTVAWFIPAGAGVVASYADNNIDGNASNPAPPAIGYK